MGQEEENEQRCERMGHPPLIEEVAGQAAADEAGTVIGGAKFGYDIGTFLYGYYVVCK
jgi:hypothetical protein